MKSTFKATLVAIVIIASSLISTTAKADFELTLESGLSFTEGSGTHAIGVFINAGPVATSSEVFGLTALFAMPVGASLGSPIGTVNEAGMVASTPGGSGAWVNAGGNAGLDVEFGSGSSGHTFSTTAARIANLNIDITGLTPGVYSIGFTPIAGPEAGNAGFVPAAGSGLFQITAVPEPSSLIVLSSAAALCLVRRRKS